MSHVEKLEQVMALLDEAAGFAALSPGGLDNISQVYEMIPEIVDEAYRRGVSDGEQNASREHDYQRGQEADYNSHLQSLRAKEGW